MTLLKFKNQTLADEFYSNYNSVQFNSIEDHLCQLAYVAKVTLLRDFYVAHISLLRAMIMHAMNRNKQKLTSLELLGRVGERFRRCLSSYSWLH